MTNAPPEEGGILDPRVMPQAPVGSSPALPTRKHISGPPPEDPGAAVASRTARIAVFIVLCQGVQMFMSYDGGAVPASLDTLQDIFHHSWSEFEIGVLGAMDKIGMVAASVPWGWALQRCNAKFLLTISLFLNALVTFVFGWLPSKGLMLTAKFLMGATQSLQGVWATVWTVNLAPPDKKTMWLGLGAVSAGIGNGIGTCVAGFGTANGLPFAFAFQLAGCILGFFWVLQLFFPSRWLRMEVPENERSPASGSGSDSVPIHDVTEESSTTESPTLESEPDPSVKEQLSFLFQNSIFVGTTWATSLCMFEVSGIQYLWTRAFTEIWLISPDQGLSKNWVTAMFIIVTGFGGGVGIAFGPYFIDKYGGIHSPPSVLRSLRILWYYQLVSALAGLGGLLALYGKNHPWDYTSPWGDVWLWLSWFCIFLIYAAQNASIAALCGINLQVVPERMRSFASGTEITIRNILGYIGGPLLPSIVMTFNSGWASGTIWQLSVGLGFVYMVNVLGIVILGRLRLAGSLDLEQQRADAIQDLREAIQREDVQRLERAVAAANRVELENWKHGDGKAVIGMANQLIGRCLAGERVERAQGSGTNCDPQLRLMSLEEEVLLQRRDIELKNLEIQSLRAQLISLMQTLDQNGHQESPPERDGLFGGSDPCV